MNIKEILHHRHALGLTRAQTATTVGLSDFSAKTLALRPAHGETDVEIFVAVLAHSQMIYAEAVPDQSVRHWTMAHRRAWEYFGGVSGRWIIDNLKAGVDKADREEPRLNRAPASGSSPRPLRQPPSSPTTSAVP